MADVAVLISQIGENYRENITVVNNYVTELNFFRCVSSKFYPTEFMDQKFLFEVLQFYTWLIFNEEHTHWFYIENILLKIILKLILTSHYF